jgi:peptidoglycan/LPS O-acetylase OafA/YrhL
MTAVFVAGNIVDLGHEYRKLGDDLAASAAFIANIMLYMESGYFADSANLKPFLHLWSLGVEEQFYIIWPLILLTTIRFSISTILITTIIAVISFFCNVISVDYDPVAAFYLPQNRFWELMIGAFASIATDGSKSPTASLNSSTRNAISVFGVALIGLAVAFVNEHRSFPGWWALLPCMGSAAILISGPDAWINRRLLAAKLMVWIGAISYPVYLWHWPIFLFVDRFSSEQKTVSVIRARILGIILTMILAWLTHILIERKTSGIFKRYPNAVAAGLAISMTALGLLGFMHLPPQQPGTGFSGLAKLDGFIAANPQESDFRRRKCFLFPDDYPSNASAFVRNGCDGGLAPRRPLILLAGDSTAAHLYPGLVSLYGDRMTIAQFTSAFCVPLIEHMALSQNRVATEKCKETNDFIFDRVASLKPDVILVSADFSIYERDSALAYPDFQQAFLKSIQKLRQIAGAPVIIAGQLPIWTNGGLTRLVGDRIKNDLPIPEYTSQNLDSAVFDIDNQLRKLPWGPGITYVSMIDSLCTGDACRILTGDDTEFPDNIIAFDRIHLSRSGAHFIVKSIIAKEIEDKLISK